MKPGGTNLDAAALRDATLRWTGNLLAEFDLKERTAAVTDLARSHRLELAALLARADADLGVRQAVLECVLNRTTWFNRDADGLAHVVAQLGALPRSVDGVRKIWIAGCAEGHEAYSLAILCTLARVPVRIHATDLSTVALARAAQGEYREQDVARVPAAWRRFFTLHRPGVWRVQDDVRAMVVFTQINLAVSAQPPSELGPPDAIVCRHVLMHFPRDVAGRILNEFTRRCALVCVSAIELPLFDEQRPRVAPTISAPLPPPRPRPTASTTSPTPPIAPSSATPASPPIASPALPTLAALMRLTPTVRAQVVADLRRDHPLSVEANILVAMGCRQDGDVPGALTAFARARFLIGDQGWLPAYHHARLCDARGDALTAAEGYHHALQLLDGGRGAGVPTIAPELDATAALVAETCRLRLQVLAVGPPRWR